MTEENPTETSLYYTLHRKYGIDEGPQHEPTVVSSKYSDSYHSVLLNTIIATSNNGTHSFPDDELPGIVVGVLKSAKNRCLGRAGKLGEQTHLGTSTHFVFGT